MSFFQYFFGIESLAREAAVCCPFPHTTAGHIEYYEQHPSAHVNLEEKVFHCKVCNRGFSEQSFVSTILGCSYGNALRLIKAYSNPEDLYQWEQEKLNPEEQQQLYGFKISPEVIRDLYIKSTPDKKIAFPVLMYNKLIDVRKYDPGARPKMRSRVQGMNGLIVPYDLWRDNPKITLLCAGEKDMAVARSFGFNSITLIGGEGALPILTQPFKNRKVIICYDNDDPGKAGAVKLAQYLKPLCASVKNCTAFHEVCTGPGEDIADFFGKYQKTKQDLITYLDRTPEFEYAQIDESAQFPVVDLHTASKSQYVGKLLRSNIQIVAVSEASFVCPATLIGEKFMASDTEKGNKLDAGDIKEWTLTEDTVQDILHMVDNDFNETQLAKNYRSVLHIPQDEKNIRIRRPHKETVFKAYVTDLFETSVNDVVPMEYTAYSIGCKLESGKKYLATYKLAPHPYKGQQLIMLITQVVQANDSVSNFTVGDAEIADLKVIQSLPGTVEERVTLIAEKFKGLLGYNGINQLITALDLAYHTVLEFNFGNQKNVRGYLDTLVVGESRMGKSSTAEAMRKAYGLGAFVSLAGNAATIPGLVGGSNKVNGSYQTRAGIIPQNHTGLIVFEELSKSNGNVLSELTDIRSSNEVRITRVSGTINLPAKVRMVSLSNVKSSEGIIKSIASYPNGIAILAELIGTAEDIARYDLMCVLSERGAREIDPLWQPAEPFAKSVYHTRVRWVWSRRPGDIVIPDVVSTYIVEQANQLNRLYDSHVKIFGTECWKKITRLATAVAGYLVSTDDTYTKIIVTSEHVHYAVSFLVRLYDNSTFRLKEYVDHERMYSTIDENGIALLQDIYQKCPSALLHLEVASSTSRNSLQAATGLPNDDYNAIMQRLIGGMFIVFSKYDIVPTERFRLGMARINRQGVITRLGARS